MAEQETYFSDDYPIKIYGLSEQSLTIEFGTVINENLLSLITGFNQLLFKKPFPGLVTAVPAYCTLTVFYDPLIISTSGLSGTTCYDKVSNYLKKLGSAKREQSTVITDNVIIPVCYGGIYGPDIATVALTNGITENEVITIHSSGFYTVFMIGFVPGFAYMGGMDRVLATPRKAIPDSKIPAGAVGIAGTQTGIYPIETPGGWQIIGRTPLKLFDVNRSQPSLLRGGARVTFKPIKVEEFNDYAV
ncbi:5-oxoprolinase subunit PxpB [Pedobacter miscanthi]|uniref:Allophanate hydrolase subunit 1 n=1 Tax=Pedobacter miscanthi TaxID=2259170 RepID=A0A366L123_9SPHI|nr:5-oxoprolinase subunit PxpB [Pedobacter miscanthi]RBQ07601.1 allophanate hydrolase subunit 1 [Pedobacter miscanthi]